jgi:hypothetical protein
VQPDEEIANSIRDIRINDNDDNNQIPHLIPGGTSGNEDGNKQPSRLAREDVRATLSARTICNDVTEKFKLSVTSMLKIFIP